MASILSSDFFNKLADNAANIIDSLGRNTASNITATGNALTSFGYLFKKKDQIPTTVTYEDNTGMYLVVAAAVVSVVLVVALKK